MSQLTSAVVAVISDDAGRVLLCQQSSGHRLWQLPGGRIRLGESPAHAVCRDVLAETGLRIEATDLVGLYELTGNTCGDDVPDVLIYAFRGSVTGGEALVNEPGRISRATWYDPGELPSPMTATTRASLADAAAGRAGVVRRVQRDPEPAAPQDGAPQAAPVSDDAALAAL
jgi:ADP-ribose pyrophosphatase YjhB (NUDIX family)